MYKGILAKLSALFLIFALCITFAPTATQASGGDSCSAFSATINGVTYKNTKVTLPAAQVSNQTMFVKGTYVEFTVDLNTFTVTNYTLTGAASEEDLTGGQRTVIFTEKKPLHNSTLTGDLFLEFNNESIRLIRAGSAIEMKIQAKDCPQGGIFQMEPSKTINYNHTLAPGFHYYLGTDGRLLFTNGIFIGKDSPEAATLNSFTESTASWITSAGGRMGMVLGHDALE
jgi:hypothetical protein